MVAHPAGGLLRFANDKAEFASRKIPPIRPLASRATQKPSWLRPMKNAGIDSLRMPGSRGTNWAVTPAVSVAGGTPGHSACHVFAAAEHRDVWRDE
jgi:hypothetical protein